MMITEGGSFKADAGFYYSMAGLLYCTCNLQGAIMIQYIVERYYSPGYLELVKRL